MNNSRINFYLCTILAFLGLVENSHHPLLRWLARSVNLSQLQNKTILELSRKESTVSLQKKYTHNLFRSGPTYWESIDLSEVWGAVNLFIFLVQQVNTFELKEKE